MRVSMIVTAAVVIAAPVSAWAADPLKAATPLGAEVLAFEGALRQEAVPGWSAQRATWARLVSETASPQVLSTTILTLEQSLGWEAVESAWKARRTGWVNDMKRADSMAAVAKLLMELEGNTRWSAVRETWKKDREGWVRRVAAIGPPASAPAPAAAVAAPAANPGGALTADSVLGTWKLDVAHSKAAADGNTAGLMGRVVLRPDGSFEALYGTKGTWKLTKGKLIVRYETVAEDRPAILDGKHLKFPAPAQSDKFCYLVR
jgi:hypothetical protein